MKKFGFIISCFIFSTIFFAGYVFADNANTGFIPGQIWYSKQPLIEGVTVDIHTIVWNGDVASLSATVEFYDKNVILGSRSVVVAKGSMKDVYVPWKVTAGDHAISASITSSKIVSGDTSKSITLDRRTTGEDKQFVSKVIETVDGVPASSGDIIKNKVLETTSKIDNIIPDAINTPVKGVFASIDNFRTDTDNKIENSKVDTQNAIDKLNNIYNSKTNPKVNSSSNPNTGISGTQKPIAYVKLFLLGVAGFIFHNKWIFYLVCAFLLFIILRFIYRKIRGR